MAKEDPNNYKMSVDKIENGIIQVRKAFSRLRTINVDDVEVLFEFNNALYRLERKFSKVRKVFYGD